MVMELSKSTHLISIKRKNQEVEDIRNLKEQHFEF